MKKNLFFKLFTIAMLFVCSITCAFASVQDLVSVKKIYVEPLNNDTYSVSLFFDKQYNDKAFLHKVDKGSYSVFLPNSYVNEKKLDIDYKNRLDKRNISFEIEQKPYVNKSNDSVYVKLNINMNKDYSLKLLSKNIKDEKFSFFSSLDINAFSFILVLLGLSVFLLLRKLYKFSKKSKLSKSFTSFPDSFYFPSLSMNFSKTIHATKPTIKESLKASDNNTFTCFDITPQEKTNMNSYNYKSSIKETSSILKKTKQTNPLAKSQYDESKHLDLPYAQKEYNHEASVQQEEEKKAELLSVLHLTPNTGFYLTNSDDKMGLFGFIGDDVFFLKSFSDLSQINLQARFYDKNGDNDVYIVRLDSYKAMVEISKDRMRELVVL